MKLERSKRILTTTFAMIGSLAIAAAANVGSRTQGQISQKGLVAKVLGTNQNQTKSSTFKQEVSFTAEAEKADFAVGDPIILKLTLTNHTDAEIYIIETSPARDYELEIRNATVGKVPLSEKGKRILEAPSFRTVVSRIDPGQVVHQETNVGDLYDLPAASAAYTVTIKRRILLQDKKKFAGVQSNPVKVIVHP